MMMRMHFSHVPHPVEVADGIRVGALADFDGAQCFGLGEQLGPERRVAAAALAGGGAYALHTHALSPQRPSVLAVPLRVVCFQVLRSQPNDLIFSNTKQL